jgi:hypothetical protein
MEWRKLTLRKTIPWDKRTNTARFYTAPDTRQYRAFEDQFDAKSKSKTAERERVCYDAHVDWEANVVTDDDPDGNDDWGGAKARNREEQMRRTCRISCETHPDSRTGPRSS